MCSVGSSCVLLRPPSVFNQILKNQPCLTWGRGRLGGGVGFSFPLHHLIDWGEKLGRATELVHGYQRFVPPSGSRSLGHPSFLLASNKMVVAGSHKFQGEGSQRGRGGVTFPEAQVIQGILSQGLCSFPIQPIIPPR